MKEVFENLAEQAMVHVPGSTGLHTRAFSLEKFAELIVRECAGVCEDYRGTEWGKAAECIGDSIKEHFGVEE
jgi:hypothetical protein